MSQPQEPRSSRPEPSAPEKGAFASVLPVLLIALIVVTPVCYAVMERSGQGASYDVGQALGAALAAVAVFVLPISLSVRRRMRSRR